MQSTVSVNTTSVESAFPNSHKAWKAALLGVLTLCSIVGFAAPASAEQSPCPATVAYYQTLIIHNGFDNFPYLEWVENSQLTRTEGSGSSATCYYVGTLYYSHPYQTLKDPQFRWYSDPLTLAALSE